MSPADQYTAIGVYAQRDPVGYFPGIFAYYESTHDSNIGPGSPAQGLTQAASAWAYALELDESFFNGDVMLGIRPVEYLSALQATRSGYDVAYSSKPHYGTFDILLRDPKITPYLWLLGESDVAAASNAPLSRPTWRIGVRWASPVRGPIKQRRGPPAAASGHDSTGRPHLFRPESLSRRQRLDKSNITRSIMNVAAQHRGVEELVRGPIKSKTVFPVLVLHLLSEQPDHGLGLMGRIESICAGLLAVNTNTIYPLLRRLEERGFIVGEWEHPTKRSRRYYRITDAGRARLERIKTGMLPYLDTLAESIARLRGNLYGTDAA